MNESLPCEKMIKAALAEAQKMGLCVSVAVADENGNLLHFGRDENAILPSINIAINKAYSAVAMRMTTEELGKHGHPHGTLFGINIIDQKLVIFGGGIPLKKNGKICGGIGVSGASVQEDIQIAQKAVEAFEAN